MLITRSIGEDTNFACPPFVRAWDSERPLRAKEIHSARRRATSLPAKAPPWVYSGDPNRPFDFCRHIRRLCHDIVAHSETFQHIDLSRVLFTVTQARSHRLHGLQARVTPLRFRGGELTRRRHGTLYRVQRYFVDGREALYVVAFCLPRFLDQDFDSKLVTLFHELYHIGPDFDGDLRRHDGRYSLHSHSKHDYDRLMADLARTYLSNGAQASLHDFLRLDFGQLQERHGSVVGNVVPRPKLIPVPAKRARDAITPCARH